MSGLRPDAITDENSCAVSREGPPAEPTHIPRGPSAPSFLLRRQDSGRDDKMGRYFRGNDGLMAGMADSSREGLMPGMTDSCNEHARGICVAYDEGRCWSYGRVSVEPLRNLKK